LVNARIETGKTEAGQGKVKIISGKKRKYGNQQGLKRRYDEGRQ